MSLDQACQEASEHHPEPLAILIESEAAFSGKTPEGGAYTTTSHLKVLVAPYDDEGIFWRKLSLVCSFSQSQGWFQDRYLTQLTQVLLQENINWWSHPFLKSKSKYSTPSFHPYLLQDDKRLYFGPSSVTGKISKLCHLANHSWIGTKAEAYYDIYLSIWFLDLLKTSPSLSQTNINHHKSSQTSKSSSNAFFFALCYTKVSQLSFHPTPASALPGRGAQPLGSVRSLHGGAKNEKLLLRGGIETGCHGKTSGKTHEKPHVWLCQTCFCSWFFILHSLMLHQEFSWAPHLWKCGCMPKWSNLKMRISNGFYELPNRLWVRQYTQQSLTNIVCLNLMGDHQTRFIAIVYVVVLQNQSMSLWLPVVVHSCSHYTYK